MAVKSKQMLKIYRREVKEQVDSVSAYESLEGSYKVFLEFPDQKGGTQTIIGLNPYLQIRSSQNEIEVIKEGEVTRTTGNPLQKLKELIAGHHSDQTEIAKGIGYFGYDFIRSAENIGPEKINDLNTYDLNFLFHSHYLMIQQDGTAEYCLVDYEGSLTEEQADHILNEQAAKLEALLQVEKTEDFKISGFVSETGKEQFEEAVRRLKAHILEGDIFQAVLSHRFNSSFTGDPFQFFKKLRIYNKSMYRYYMDFETYQIAGSSPERLITVKENKILSNPIAGTRRRGESPVRDLELENELLNDEKERAEHYMLVDLARNDLGKVSKPSTVKVTKLMEIEKYINVMHLVSDVEGMLDEQVHFLDTVASSLPAGTVSGAPKIKAMQLINEIEKTRRGIYGGGIGYFTHGGSLDLALTIRTMIFTENKAYLQAGAGIVHDSVPESEWNETLFKANGLLEALK
ncbi:anthranilate synthase component 1 [Peribacillus deserti]|uniref:Anthranilate synthase component 1 n=1 Tax=Peribacillus deserti TaxID=673318 RepID=A0ABS2QL15_9BACI|nr:chorismate-binding protein [Peribacillus deserti]MBM7693853.1 anthranilate synthase component 1 [Peribacillus deserti]